MRTRLLTFAVWALVSASAVYWGLALFVRPAGLPAQARLPAQRVALAGDLHKLLGVTAVAQADEPAASTGAERYRLLGVVAPRGAEVSPQGVALIAVDGQPARAWRTGSVVEGDTVLLAVTQRGATLGPRGSKGTTVLSLPEPNRSAGAAAVPALGLPGAHLQGMNLNGLNPAMRPGMLTPDPVAQPVPLVSPGAVSTNEEQN